ncbi:MAG: AsnC family transcriptional regulator [Candidatus Wildermuthbacteria bacterium]|nr:AsnC family transcriptional regulator [Candidatus Wildermuthbacteria bacterium]
MDIPKNLLDFQPIQAFVKGIGKDVENYFGKDDGAIIYLQPDGIWYAEGLYQWLRQRKQNLVIATMEDDGAGLEEDKVKGRKVLVVDNDVVTGKAYKRAMEALRVRKRRLNIRDIKFATFFDRIGVADFFVEKYSAEAIWHFDEFDAVDLKIIKQLAQDGKKPLAEIGKAVGLSAVSVKNRIDKLVASKTLEIRGMLRIDQFFVIAGHIFIEADGATISKLLEQFEHMQEVLHVARTIGKWNLLVCVLGHNVESIEQFINSTIHTHAGVKRLEVYLGELPAKPKLLLPQA